MSNFLRNLNVDRLSFWLGFLASTIFWFLILRLRPAFRAIAERIKAQAAATKEEAGRSGEIRLENDILRYAQTWHLASPLFSLEEILIQPRLLAPPPAPEPGKPPPGDDITEWVIPYLPDWPELGSFYNAPTLSLAQALSGGSNLALIGQSGCGKTVALACLATQIIRHDPEATGLERKIPILIHAADLILPPRNPENPLETLQEAISGYASRQTTARLPKLLQTLFEQKRALLLLDGLDEMPPAALDNVVMFLQALQEKYPETQMVAAASSIYLGGLPSLGFVPIPMANWNQEQRGAFIRQWGEMWSRYSAPGESGMQRNSDPYLIHGWLLTETAHLSPLELTLKIWAAFAGDSLGPNPVDAIEAYIRRMTANQPAKNRAAMSQLAMNMTFAMQPLTERKNAESWLGGGAVSVETVEDSAHTPPTEALAPEQPKAAERVRAPGALPDLVECGLMTMHPEEKVRLVHPLLTGYLAGQAPSQLTETNRLLDQPRWNGKFLALHYLVLRTGQEYFVDQIIEEENADPLMQGLFTAAHWLREAGDKAAWATSMMRRLAGYLQKEKLSLGNKARCASALAFCGNASVAMLFRQMLSAVQEDQRMLALLGLGVLRDSKTVADVGKLLADRSAKVSRAAILALVAIGDKMALEAVAYTLLHGDEGMRRAAAEGLANHPEEGYPTLEEGSTLEDTAVRRAVVFGLSRINAPWSLAILERLRTEDKQWVVQDAAAHALDVLSQPDPHIPRPLAPLTHTPWLIAFAGERGMGVVPGKPAFELLYQGLREGDAEQREAAIYFLSRNGDENSILPLYQTYFSERGELREAALFSLWCIAATGIKLPPPMQYGLK
ncbi:MAG: HEAT repeat domain-containing protein [Anaerolineales bacterium]|nr:HEAT repeat domain-containing protein [Anaerolineales bacterium]